MSDPYAETDEWPTPSLPARPVFDRADNTARLALEVASLKREKADLQAEVGRLREALRIVQLDNHHNAAVCPYCDPPTAVLAAPPAAPEAAATTGRACGHENCAHNAGLPGFHYPAPMSSGEAEPGGHQWWDADHGRPADAYTPPEDVYCLRCRRGYSTDETCRPALVVAPSAEDGAE